MSQNKNFYKIPIIVVDPLDSKKEKRDKEQIQKKIQKIELLKENILKIEQKIEKIKMHYNKIVLPEQEIFFKQKEIFIEKLMKRFNQKSFSENQKTIISSLIEEEIGNLNDQGYNSEKLQEISEEIFSLYTHNINEDEVDFLNEMTKEMLQNFGVDIDDEEFDFRNINDPDFIEKAKKSFYENENNSHKEIEELNKLTKAQNTDKDFYRLYKSLVKKAHPDLVIDSLEKEQREVWMKELSQIWNDRDYMGLLVMEKKILGENGSNITLNHLQTKPLIKQLNERIQSLEAEKYILTSRNPETAFYFQNFKGNTEKTFLKKIQKFKEEISLDIEKTHNETQLIKTQKSTKEFIRMYNDISLSSDYDYIDDLFFT